MVAGRQILEIEFAARVQRRAESGGAIVVFEAKVIRALSGRLDAGGTPPAYGTLSVTVGDAEFRSPLNASGEFYFEDLPPGDHPGIATWSGRTCRATIRMPDKAPAMTDAGVVTCVTGPQ